MADSDSEKSLDVDLPPELDDDLGDDWETAFEAEDFFVDDSDEAQDFFLADDDSSENFDLAALLDQESAGMAADSDEPESEESRQESAAEPGKDEKNEELHPARCLVKHSNGKIIKKDLFRD